jgi:UDP-2-acetamido-3-amino-2,3-dideoxy-glucuronate N-acetyltransferase
MPISDDVKLGVGTKIFNPDLVNIYGCEIGAHTTVGPFVEIQRGAKIGDYCKISSHTFICDGVTIGNEVFVGHGVMFINDRNPKTATNGQLSGAGDWTMETTIIGNGVSIGSGATIMSGLSIEDNAVVGAGAVVTKSVTAGVTVVGNPARFIENKY